MQAVLTLHGILLSEIDAHWCLFPTALSHAVWAQMYVVQNYAKWRIMAQMHAFQLILHRAKPELSWFFNTSVVFCLLEFILQIFFEELPFP